MTTPPTFTTGQVLTAAQMNTIGMFLIKEQTIGTGVTGVTVSNAFSSDYDNYRIIMSGVDSSNGDAACIFYFGSYTADTYYGNMEYYKIGSGRGDLPVNSSNFFYSSITGTNDDTMMIMDVINPQQAKRTICYGYGFGWLSTFNFGALTNNATQFTSFTTGPGSGTWTGGKVRVYGYRN